MWLVEYINTYDSFHNHVHRLDKINTHKIGPLLEDIHKYLAQEVTKASLAENITSPYTNKAISDLSSTNEDMIDATDALLELSDVIYQHWTNIYKILFNHSFPILDTYDVGKLYMPAYVFTQTGNGTTQLGQPDLIELSQNLTNPETYESAMFRLIDMMFKGPEKTLNTMKHVYTNGKTLYTQLSELRDQMKEYLERGRMDTSFYL